MKIAFNPSTVAALTTPPNNKDITFDLRGRNIFARGVKFYGTDTNTWRDIKINNVSIGSHTLDLQNGSNTTLTNTNGVVTINSTWRPVVDNLTSDSTTSSLSAKQGKVLKALIDGKSNSDHNHDGRYLRLSGQDTMQGNLYLHSHGTSYIGKGLGDKSGADFTEANIVIRSWWGISFKSYDDIVRTYIDTRTGNIGTKGVLNAVGAVIQGRVYNDGDDEGIIINSAPNGYAGLILGTHNGERSVFYLKKGNPFWRYNNGSTNLDIYHPKKSGTIALTSDIPNKDSWNYDDRYLRLTGGWMSGNINFGGDNKIYWGRNTDSASISFKNDGDMDANSYMSFVTSDNGNEYFRWSHSSGSTNTEWMALRGDGLRVRGTKVSLEGHSHNDLYYTKAESNAKYITDITTSVNKLTFTRNGSNIIRDITVNVVHSQGQLPNIPNKDATTKANPGLLIYDSYNQTIGTNPYSSVLSINTGGTIQIAGNWGDDYTRNLYWRSQSDRNVANYPWKSWRTILDSENYSSTLDSRYYTESEVNSLLSKKLNTSDFNWTNLPGKLVAGSEFNIVNAGFNEEMWFNWLPINNRNSTATVRGYHFGNGAKGYASVQASGFIKTGSSSSYVLLGDGGHKLERALNVAYSKYLTGIAITGGNNNNIGYRLIFEKTMGGWDINYGVWAIAFRHSGRGTLNIGFDTTNSDGSTYTYDIRFLGSIVSIEHTPFRAFYNSTTKVFRIYWHYVDYTSGDIAVLRGNMEPHNGTWMTSLPNDVGTELAITYNMANQAVNADTVDGVHLNGIFTGFSYAQSGLTATIGTVSKTVNVTGSYPNIRGVTMNTIASYGNCMGMANLVSSNSNVNPNNQTSWHHFINMSHNTESNNMWQTQFAIKAGTTEVWVRSRAGGSISDSSAWAAPWVRLARITDNIASATNADMVDGEHASSFVRAGHYDSNDLNKLDTYSFIRSVKSNVSSTSPKGNTGWYNVIQLVHRNGASDGPGYIGQIALGMTTNTDDMFFRGKRTDPWKTVIHSGNIGNQTVANAYHLRINSANTWSTWYWAGQSGQPRWLWGSNDGTNMYVWNPSNFRVAYASSAGDADTVDGEHASNFSYTHQSSFDFSKKKSGRIVTFDQSNTDYGWINGFASTHSNYLTSVIFNKHRSSNWYVGYMEGNVSTGETNGLQAVHKLAFADGDEYYPIFLGYLHLHNGNDGTINGSFPCLGYSVPFTYTRGGSYCRIYIPDTAFQTFYIKAAIASVHYSGSGMGNWVGEHRGDGAWWLHCDAVSSNTVQVKGFHLANRNNDSWWGGNPLYSGNGAAKIITVCLFGYVKFI